MNSVHLSDSIVYANSWADVELRHLFTEQSRISGWLEVMTVLAKVQASYGLIPQQAAVEIATGIAQLEINETLLNRAAEGFQKTNHSLLGLINAVKPYLGELGGEWLCYGATVQDITDTHNQRILLQVAEKFLQRLNNIEQVLIALAQKHQYSLMPGRTHSQPGLPITFGFKTAVWLDELHRHKLRLKELKPRLAVGQMAGGVGSLSSLGEQALSLQRDFLQHFQLQPPRISWTSSRDRLAEWLNCLALITSTADKIGLEIVQLQRPEIAELSEGFIEGTVGSITMPQKRNPELSEHLATLSRVVRHHAAHMMENLVHSHERDGRSWKGEWLIIPEATLATGKVLALLQSLLENLQVNTDNMLSNLSATDGFLQAERLMLKLAGKVGKQSAHTLVYQIAMQAKTQQQSFLEMVKQHPQISQLLTDEDINQVFDLQASIGACAEMVDRVIAGIVDDEQP